MVTGKETEDDSGMEQDDRRSYLDDRRKSALQRSGTRSVSHCASTKYNVLELPSDAGFCPEQTESSNQSRM